MKLKHRNNLHSHAMQCYSSFLCGQTLPLAQNVIVLIIVTELPLYLGQPVATVTHHRLTSEPISAHHDEHKFQSHGHWSNNLLICHMYYYCTEDDFNCDGWDSDNQHPHSPSLFILLLLCLHSVLCQSDFSSIIIKAHLM